VSTGGREQPFVRDRAFDEHLVEIPPGATLAR
jgi:hypothetical protein